MRNETRQRMYERFASAQLSAARLDTPVILLTGGRQVGKSTLARAAARSAANAPIRIGDHAAHNASIPNYATFDDATTRASATADPAGYVERYRDAEWSVIDEVQRVPDVLVAIKELVDRDRRPGRFLLTASADVRSIPPVAESLAGRVDMVSLWPLAQAEIERTSPAFIEHAFAERFPTKRCEDSSVDIMRRALWGGFPEPLTRKRPDRRDAWFGNYLTTVVQREVSALSAIEEPTAIVRILRALASRSGGPRNIQSLSIDAAVPATTLTRYIALLEATFLVRTIPAWSNNLDARIMRSPKLLLVDSGLYGYLLGLHATDDATGFLIETLVGTELLKLTSRSPEPIALLHFRDKRGNEVDFVLEHRDRRVVGVEVKKARSVQLADFRGLRKLAAAAGERFTRGIVLYSGTETLPFGPRFVAVPLAALWTNGIAFDGVDRERQFAEER